MYAGDLAKIVSDIIKRFNEIPAIMNVGLGYDYTVNEYYQIISDIVGYKGTFSHDLTKPSGMKQKLLDVSIQKSLGLEAKYTLAEGVQETYKYYLERIL